MLERCASYTAAHHNRLSRKEPLTTKNIRVVAFTVAVFGAGFALGHVFDTGSTVSAQGHQVFELRTYTTNEGKLPNLLTRFRDHTMRIFENHDMTNVGYFVPQDSR